eukprot:COSAG05_NODE_15028_length_380_cov_0.921708_1_plen_37_part_01
MYICVGLFCSGLQLSSKANSHAWWCNKYKCCYHNTSA